MSDIDDLVRVYSGSIPSELTATDLGEDIAYALASQMALAKQEVERLNAGANLSTSTGLFLDQQAKDRDLRRQEDEEDDPLRERLRHPPKAVTPNSIIDALQAIVGDPDTVGRVFLVELPRDSAYADSDLWEVGFFDRWHALAGPRHGMVIALIPASADVKTAAEDALRSKASAGKVTAVFEYTEL